MNRNLAPRFGVKLLTIWQNMNLTDRIESIYLKTKELALKVERLQKENTALKKENQKLKTNLERCATEIRELTTRKEEEVEQREKTISPELGAQIDHYIQEIDKCIAWLQKQ